MHAEMEFVSWKFFEPASAETNCITFVPGAYSYSCPTVDEGPQQPRPVVQLFIPLCYTPTPKSSRILARTEKLQQAEAGVSDPASASYMPVKWVVN